MADAKTRYPEEVFKSEVASGAPVDRALAAAVATDEIQKFNTCHKPGGSGGGQFCSSGTGGKGGTSGGRGSGSGGDDASIASELVHTLGKAGGVTYKPRSYLMDRLAKGVGKMRAAGVKFDATTMSELTAEGGVHPKYHKVPGFKEVDSALNKIYAGRVYPAK